jgi:hypothetical protein
MVRHALACPARSGFPPIWRDRRYFSVVENRRLRTGKMAQRRVLCLAGEDPAVLRDRYVQLTQVAWRDFRPTIRQ